MIARGWQGVAAAFAAASCRRLPIAAWAAAAAAAHVLLWGGALALSRRAPALDSAEQLVWSYALQAGYWKHPPLPTWLMHGLVGVFGPSVALTFIAAQACVAIALLIMWRLGCEFMSPRRSLAAMALSSLVIYHNLGAEAFNHATVLLPLQAATTLLFFLAVRRGRWHHWALAGLCAALAMLVKYVTLFPLAALLLYFALDRGVQNRRNLLGLLLAAGVFALVLLPHALWSQAHGYPPLRYAHSVVTTLPTFAGALFSLADFLFTQLQRLLPLLLAVGWLCWRRPASAPAPEEQMQAQRPDDRLFLWIAGAAPLLMILLYALVTRTDLLARWGSNAFLLSGWLALDALGRRAPSMSRALRVAGCLQLTMCLAATVLAPRLGVALQLHGRSQFPGDAVAALARATWREHQGSTPLRLLVSDVWLGGNLVAHGGRPPPAVLIDGEAERVPWVGPQDLAGCGALVLQGHGGIDAAVPGVDAYLARASIRGQWTIPWSRGGAAPGPDAAGLRIDWGIIPPTGGPCRL